MTDEILKKINEITLELNNICRILDNGDEREIRTIDLYRPYELAKAIRVAVVCLGHMKKHWEIVTEGGVVLNSMSTMFLLINKNEKEIAEILGVKDGK